MVWVLDTYTLVLYTFPFKGLINMNFLDILLSVCSLGGLLVGVKLVRIVAQVIRREHLAGNKDLVALSLSRMSQFTVLQIFSNLAVHAAVFYGAVKLQLLFFPVMVVLACVVHFWIMDVQRQLCRELLGQSKFKLGFLVTKPQ